MTNNFGKLTITKFLRRLTWGISENLTLWLLVWVSVPSKDLQISTFLPETRSRASNFPCSYITIAMVAAVLVHIQEEVFGCLADICELLICAPQLGNPWLSPSLCWIKFCSFSLWWHYLLCVVLINTMSGPIKTV